MPDKKIRMTISIPEWHHDLLEKWGWMKGRSAAAMGSDIIQARVEVNLEQIIVMMESRAKALGISLEELISDIKNDKEKDSDKSGDKDN